MDYKFLGQSGINVSRLCFGTLTIGPLQANLSLEAGAAVLAHGVERGINFCDTAELYETYAYIRRAMELTQKHDLVIASKTYAYNKPLAEKAFDDARRALNRDYIDIFLLHEQESIHTLNGHAEALEFLYEQKQKGLIKAVGASMHHVAAVLGAREKALDVIHPMLNLNGLGIVDGSREDMEKAITKAHDAGIGSYAMKVLGGGNLFKNATECLTYALNQDYIDSIAIGMQSIDEVDANIEFFETLKFSSKSQDLLAQKERRLHVDYWCEGCGECVKKCGQNALEVRGGVAVCEHEKCVLCGYCSAVCPAWAIKVV